MAAETAPDIGTLASLARTALDDPAGLPEPYATEIQRAERRATRPHDDPIVTFAIDRLNDIMRVTDPVDDEREIERCADSLDALGRAIERIREQAAGGVVLASRAHAYNREREAFSEHVTRALDALDEGVATLRYIVDCEAADEHACEDCAVNGEDCRVHGEAAKLARRAIAQSPDGVLHALRQAGLGE
jgi:hypothetical protein